mmetsp:Transcript_63352/g.187211  ORF Transcript_63352/g.187211 Transcript_63352/m.187211 type:complete len:365 (-) Transcript_63352:104-1198(-)
MKGGILQGLWSCGSTHLAVHVESANPFQKADVLQHELNDISANVPPIQKGRVKYESVKVSITTLNQIIEQHRATSGVSIAKKMFIIVVIRNNLEGLLKGRDVDIKVAVWIMAVVVSIINESSAATDAIHVVIEHIEIIVAVFSIFRRKQQPLGDMWMHEAVISSQDPNDGIARFVRGTTETLKQGIVTWLIAQSMKGLLGIFHALYGLTIAQSYHGLVGPNTIGAISHPNLEGELRILQGSRTWRPGEFRPLAGTWRSGVRNFRPRQLKVHENLILAAVFVQHTKADRVAATLFHNEYALGVPKRYRAVFQNGKLMPVDGKIVSATCVIPNSLRDNVGIGDGITPDEAEPTTALSYSVLFVPIC